MIEQTGPTHLTKVLPGYGFYRHTNLRNGGRCKGLELLSHGTYG